MAGVFHNPRLAEMDARHGGSIIDTQIARAVADAPWDETLLADVAAVQCRRLRDSRSSSSGTIDGVAAPGPRHQSQPRPAGDRGEAMTSRDAHRVPGQFSLVLHTHLPWLAHHGRWPVGEVALPVVGRFLPAVDAGAADPWPRGRRGLITLNLTQ